MIKFLPNIENSLSSKAIVSNAPIFRKKEGILIPSDLQVKYKDGTAKLTTEASQLFNIIRDNDCVTKITTYISNLKNIKMGRYSYSISPNNKMIFCGYIETSPYFRMKGIAEILRLSSLMEFKENNLSALTLDSKPGAVLFHSKYKFLPDVERKGIAKLVMEDILSKKGIDSYYKEKARILLAETKKNEHPINLKTELSNEINTFLTSYIKKYSDNWSVAKFTYNLPMILTKQRLEEYSDFFNSLYKKHGIDYKI